MRLRPLLLALTALCAPATLHAASTTEAQVAAFQRLVPDVEAWTVTNRTALIQAVERRPQQGLGTALPCDRTATTAQLTPCLLQHVSDLARGFVPAATLGADWHLPRPPETNLDELARALRAGQLHAYLAGLVPDAPAYAALVAALAHYEALVATPWPPIPTDQGIVESALDARFPDVVRRLILEGELTSADSAFPEVTGAVRQFQGRNGLAVDGRLGVQTLAALNVTPQERIARIAVALERWRQGLHAFPADRVEVNVADEMVRIVVAGKTELSMRVIVGNLTHPTPVFAAQISAITVNPAWTIPVSIATREILPKLRRNPTYLKDHEIAILGRAEDPYGLTIDWRRVKAAGFGYQLRQAPGAKNPLGAVKFEMANPDDVYMHDTPAKELFLRPQRTFSHGCIRLERAADLADRVLALFGSDSVNGFHGDTATHTLPLKRRMPVFILYQTAFADEAGRINFRPDVYGRDVAVAAALGYPLHPAPRPRGPAEVSCASPDPSDIAPS